LEEGMADEYPRILYRPGSQYRIWGIDCDGLIVNDEAEHDAAVADGWSIRPVGGKRAKAEQPPPEELEPKPEPEPEEPEPEFRVPPPIKRKRNYRAERAKRAARRKGKSDATQKRLQVQQGEPGGAPSEGPHPAQRLHEAAKEHHPALQEKADAAPVYVRPPVETGE
jgi:hypothetical protein